MQKLSILLLITVIIDDTLGDDCGMLKFDDKEERFVPVAFHSADYIDNRICDEYCLFQDIHKEISVIAYNTILKTILSRTTEIFSWIPIDGCKYFQQPSRLDVMDCFKNTIVIKIPGKTENCKRHKNDWFFPENGSAHIEFLDFSPGFSAVIKQVYVGGNKTRVLILVQADLKTPTKLRIRDELINRFVGRNYSRELFHNVDTQFCTFMKEFCANPINSKFDGPNLAGHLRNVYRDSVQKNKNRSEPGSTVNRLLSGIAVAIVLFSKRF